MTSKNKNVFSPSSRSQIPDINLARLCFPEEIHPHPFYPLMSYILHIWQHHSSLCVHLKVASMSPFPMTLPMCSSLWEGTRAFVLSTLHQIQDNYSWYCYLIVSTRVFLSKVTFLVSMWDMNECWGLLINPSYLHTHTSVMPFDLVAASFYDLHPGYVTVFQ